MTEHGAGDPGRRVSRPGKPPEAPRPERGAPGRRDAAPSRGSGGPKGGSGAPRGGSGAPVGRRVPAGGGAEASRGRGQGPNRAGAADRPYDPRREARRQLTRVELPEDVDVRELDPAARKELLTLAKDTADLVARHLVMAGRLMDEDPAQGLKHARAARAMAGRVGAVREANGLVAYLAGEWTEALSELKAARRITGSAEHLAVMADCERALGRPDRALTYAQDPQLTGLPPAARVELLIVCSGARRDLGQPEAAVRLLEVGELEGSNRPWTARLRYAYADALLSAGREDDARRWFAEAVEADELGETDADERLLALDGLVLDDEQVDHDVTDDVEYDVDDDPQARPHKPQAEPDEEPDQPAGT